MCICSMHVCLCIFACVGHICVVQVHMEAWSQWAESSTFSNEADSQANLELADTALASSPACSRDSPTPLSEAGITDRKLCIAGFRGVLEIQAVVLAPASANETLSYPHSPISILKSLVHRFLYGWVSCLRVCMCLICVPGAHRWQKRMSCPLGLQLGVTDDWAIMMYWRLNTDPLAMQSRLLLSELPLQSLTLSVF